MPYSLNKIQNIDEFDRVIAEIKSLKDHTDEQISKKIGKNEGYITQNRSRANATVLCSSVPRIPSPKWCDAL